MKAPGKNKLIRIIATWTVTSIMVTVFVLDIITVALSNRYVSNLTILQQEYKKSDTADRIHFLNTANSDCILLESNGHFALIDSGEGDENPRKKTSYNGFSDEVTAYLKKVASNENGIVKLDFILATHMHYDHSGNLETIINDDCITIEKAFVKEYTAEDFTDTENETWGNYGTYCDIISALEENNIPVITDIPTEDVSFGDFTLRFINHTTPDSLKDKGDNANSIGLKITKGNLSAFLAADFTENSGLEDYYADDIGDVDVLKIGHHGYFGSSSADFLRVLKPEIAICTNYLGKVYPNVKWNITMVAKAPLLSTEHRNGIITDFTENKICIYENIM